MSRTLIHRVGLFLVVGLFATAVLAESSDTQFLDGLRERRLYRLIDIFCQDRWAEANISDRALADVASGWLRAGTQRALESTPQQRSERWQRIHQIAADYRKRAADSPFALLVTTQFALSELARAELAREEAQLSPDGEIGLKLSRDSFRSAIGQLQSAEAATDDQLRLSYQRAPSKSSPAVWTTTELESVRRHLHFELARAFRKQAVCYPAASPDRINALSLSLEKLQPIASERSAESLVWQARIEQVVCLRLLERLSDARAQLALWNEAQPPADVRARLAGEALRLDVAEGSFDRALATARKLLHDRTSVHAPETDAAILEILLASRELADPQAASRITQEAAEAVHEIGVRHGPYWKRRAETALGRALAKDSNTDDPALLVRAAESLYAAGRWKDAVAAYDRAVQRFALVESSEQRFKTATTAAAIVRQAGNLDDALERFRRLALSAPQHPRAPELHLAAIGLAADLVRAATRSQQDAAAMQFRRLLREHLSLWPDSAQADTARWWLARQLISRRSWAEALDMLAGIDGKSEHFAEGVLATVECYRQQLLQLERPSPENATARRRLTADATRRLQPVITGTENRWPEKWSPLQRTVAAIIAELQLKHVPHGSEYAEKLLAAAVAGASESEPTWKARAKSLLAAAMLRNGKIDQGRQLLRAVLSNDETKADNLTSFLSCLRLKSVQDQQIQHELAGVVLEFVERAEGQPAAATLLRYQGLAHELLGNRPQALAAYQRWTELQPQAGDAHEAYATLLGQGDESQELRKALAIWQRVERRSRAGGRRWVRARSRRIQLLARLEGKEQAEKLYRLTLVLYPQLEAELPLGLLRAEP